jgi:hypothetical protein
MLSVLITQQLLCASCVRPISEIWYLICWFALVVIVFIMVVIGSFVFGRPVSAFFFVGRACLDFIFLSKKLLFVAKRT